MMLLDLGLLFFVLLGSKLVLGVIVVYMLLPGEEHCSICDAVTLPIEDPPGAGRLLRLLRLQRRWCMECHRDSLCRGRGRLHLRGAGSRVPVAEHRVR